MKRPEIDQIPDISRVASLLADPGRARMLCQLMAGQALTATELSKVAGLTAQAASNHLARLRQAGMVTVISQGRHRYYALASEAIAHAIEALTSASHAIDQQTARFKPSTPLALRQGRTCYQHLAGQLGVALFDTMQDADYWAWTDKRTLIVTDAGWLWLQQTLNVTPPNDSRRNQEQLRPCLDWSERRYHAAGRCANAMFAAMLAHGWLEHGPGRQVRLTRHGRQALSLSFPGFEKHEAGSGSPLQQQT